jgi:hypothetical protein
MQAPSHLPTPIDDGACGHLPGIEPSTAGRLIELPEGWDLIPGARGCTQTTDYQREMAERLRLPFEILSDAKLTFANTLALPTFETGGMQLIKRLTLRPDRNRVLPRLSVKRERRASHRVA